MFGSLSLESVRKLTRTSDGGKSLLKRTLTVLIVALVFVVGAVGLMHSETIPEDTYLSAACRMPWSWVKYVTRGWDPGTIRNHDLVIVPKAYTYMGTSTDSSHSGPWDFLQKVPLVFYGPGFIRSTGSIAIDREVTVADIAPTVARVMGMELKDRPSAPIERILRPTDRRPRLVFVVVIDGGGWNALERWPTAWPALQQLMADGASVEDAIVGSSPSITPAIHTNASTGTWPRFHGVTAIAVRDDDGAIVGAFSDVDSDNGMAAIKPKKTIRVPTVNDLWDVRVGNRAKIGAAIPGNYPLGMLGVGSRHPGGDRDILAGLGGKGWATKEAYYRLPAYVNEVVGKSTPYIREVDLADGNQDGKWRGHGIAPIYATPAHAPWQTDMIKLVMNREDFGDDGVTDLFWANYKSPDGAGHKWNMTAPEQKDVLRSVDNSIAEIRRWLERKVGSENYVLVVTADHGQTPIDGRGWAISRNEITTDVNMEFDHTANGLGVLQRSSASSFFMNREEILRNDTSPEAISSFLTRYRIRDNIAAGDKAPAEFADRLDEQIFKAVFPGRKIPAVVACTKPTN